jgi:uncharacterized protein (TIGR02058 family)
MSDDFDPERAPAFLEMGLGVDLFGEDQTKAARRAVREAIGRTSLPGITRLVPSGRREGMRVRVTVAVPRPDEVDAAAVAAELPYGEVEVVPVEGGMRTPNGTLDDEGAPVHLTIATAVVAVGW